MQKIRGDDVQIVVAAQTKQVIVERCAPVARRRDNLIADPSEVEAQRSWLLGNFHRWQIHLSSGDHLSCDRLPRLTINRRRGNPGFFPVAGTTRCKAADKRLETGHVYEPDSA
jgi:hypothetical protein